MVGWIHSSVAKCADSKVANVPSAKPTHDVELDLATDSESVKEPTAQSKPIIESSPKHESRIDGCNNSS